MNLLGALSSDSTFNPLLRALCCWYLDREQLPPVMNQSWYRKYILTSNVLQKYQSHKNEEWTNGEKEKIIIIRCSVYLVYEWHNRIIPKMGGSNTLPFSFNWFSNPFDICYFMLDKVSHWIDAELMATILRHDWILRFSSAKIEIKRNNKWRKWKRRKW